MNLQENINRIKEVMGLLNEQSGKIVSISGTVPIIIKTNPQTGKKIDETDWDLVHAWFGSKRLTDDLEQRVGDELSKGNYRVSKIQISSVKSGNNIDTNGNVYLKVVGPNEVPHKVFTTRGSIGGDYVNRHDNQVDGLSDRLKVAYKSNKVDEFGPYIVSIDGTGVNYKQTFFAVELGGSNTPQQVNKKNYKIIGTDINDLREKLKQQTKGISIDINSLNVDMNNYTVIFNEGNEQIKVLSLIFSDKGELEQVFQKVKNSNPTIEEIERGKINNIDWLISVIR
jgi:hypothetical protein